MNLVIKVLFTLSWAIGDRVEIGASSQDVVAQGVDGVQVKSVTIATFQISLCVKRRQEIG